MNIVTRYLHVHPEGTPGDGPTITFVAEVPSSGTYRLSLDFQHGGTVRTAGFTVPVGDAHQVAPAHDGHGSGTPGSDAPRSDGHGHD